MRHKSTLNVFKHPAEGASDWLREMLLACFWLSWMATCIRCWLLISVSVRAVGVFITINLLLGFGLLGHLHLWSNKGMYLIPPAFSCSVNCEHESRGLIKPYCPRLLTVLNFTPSINKAIIFLGALSKWRLHMSGWALTIVYEGCFKDLLCISGPLLGNPHPVLAMSVFIKKQVPIFFCFNKAQIIRELYFECSVQTV